MTSDIALEVNVEELLHRESLTVTDFAEIRREVYRSDTTRESFLRTLNTEYPADVTDADALWRRGIGLMAAGRIDPAIELLKDSPKPLARYLVGRALLDRGDTARARTYLEPLAEAGQPTEFRLAYAEVLARLEDTEGLAKLVEEFRVTDSRGADSAFLEGRLLELNGDYAAAIASYQRAVSLQPDHQAARFRLAYRLDLSGRDDEAIGHYERLKQVYPVPVGALINLGLLYEDHGKFDKAASCFSLVLAHDRNNLIAQMYIADAMASQEMFYDEEKERKDDKRAQILKIPVTDFELSVRSRNCLARMNIRTLGDLIRKSEAELLSFKNFGETSLNEIKEILRSKGLRLGTQADDDDRRGGGRRHRELDRDSVRSKSVAELDLSVRSRKALDTLNIMTVGQLVEVSEDQLLTCKNFGQTSLTEIKKKLADLDLSLRG